jgi:hypothetical protein
MKLCYIVLIHHKFEQAARLLRRLNGEGVSFVVHIDQKVTDEGAATFKRLVAGLPVTYARRERAQWGSYLQAAAIMSGIECAVRSGLDFDRCVILSGQDYPIASHREIVEFFESNREAEYVEAVELDVLDASRTDWSPYYRFRRYHVWLGQRRVVLPLLRKPPPEFAVFHGATWWALTREALAYVDRAFHEQTKFRRAMRTGFLVDEVYVPSLLMNSSFAPRVTRNNVTFAQWTPTSGPHPKTLRSEDLPALLDSPKLFARKVDESLDAALLDQLDAIHAVDAPA